MREIIASICLSLIFATCGLGQVSKSNPLGGRIREDYVGGQSKVLVELLKEEDASLSVPKESIGNVQMMVISVTERLPTGELKVTPDVRKQATPIPDDDQKPLTKIFQLEISNQSVMTVNPIRLPKNWESFTYQITCSITGEALPRSTAVLDMQKPTGAVTNQNFAVNVSEPIWIVDPVSGQRDPDLTIPLTSTSASFVAEVTLKQGGAETKTETPVFLPKGQQSAVKINGQAFGNQKLEIRIRPTELSSVQLILNGNDCSNLQNDPFCSWTPSFKNPFQINQDDSDLKNLKITSLSQSKLIKVRTTGPAKGNLKAKLNGTPIEVGGALNSFQISLDIATLKGLKEGENTLELEGESLQGIKLAEKPIKFLKSTKPRMVGYPTFSLEGEKLKLNYELSGDVEESKPELRFKDGNGTAGAFGSANCQKDASGNTKCSPELTVAFNSINESDKKKAQIPVKLEILAQERGSVGFEPIGTGVGFDLINQAAIKKVLDEIREVWKRDHNDTQALTNISKEVFVSKLPATDDQVKETFDKYVKQPDNSEKRKKFFQFLLGVGNFALKGFGIPIQIPADLTN
jgi:hypothetical protein